MFANQFRNYLLFTFLFLLFGACSQNSTGFVSRSYHYVTAKFNAYFLARERMAEVEKDIFMKRNDDYNAVLDVIPLIDTLKLKEYSKTMEDCIKKGAMVIQQHANSNWVEESYVLIGKARFYTRDFDKAITTFKYVNTRGKENSARYEALLGLMRTFLEIDRPNEAKKVMSFIRKQTLDKKNLANFNILQAHFYRLQSNYKGVAKYLGEALTQIKAGEAKARYFFIMGQVFQKFNRPKEAIKYYKAVFKNNPTYELIFQTKINLAQVSGVENEKTVVKIQRYFKSLLRDAKNKDYQDKIYYEMGLFELKQVHVEKAITYLQKSVETNAGNQTQKAYSYLKLGDLYYDYLQDFAQAQEYYDSALTHLPPTNEEFEEIKKRQNVLDRFVINIRTIELQDSLQKYARLDSSMLNARLNYDIMISERAKLKREKAMAEEFQKKMAENKGKNDFADPALSVTALWYFYNPTIVTLGKVDFKKKWNTRILEDNWRRSNKDISEATRDSADLEVKEVVVDEEAILKKRIDNKKADLLKILPLSDTAMATSMKKVEEALYQLGKIYYYELKESKNALRTLQRLLKDFPQSKYAPEALYFLSLSNEKLNNFALAEEYKTRLVSEFPNSTFAKLIVNPEYIKEMEKIKQQVNLDYKKAFELYQGGQWNAAKMAMEKILIDHPENELKDKIAFIEVEISIRTEEPVFYKQKLSQFIQEYANSPLVDRAKQLLDKANELYK